MINKFKVAIADCDQQSSRALLELLGRDPAFEVVGIAGNGEAMLEIIKEKRPDILILELVMSHTDGMGVLEEINKMDGYRPTTLVLSGFGHGDIVQRVMELGAAYYLLKPVKVEVLYERIRFLAGVKPALPKVRALAKASLGQDNRQAPLDKEVADFVRRIGIPAHIKGYYYIRDAVFMVITDVALANAITSKVYPVIAEKYHTKTTRVERAIRHAIEVASTRGNLPMLQQLFGQASGVRGRITNAEFIATVADRLKYQRN